MTVRIKFESSRRWCCLGWTGVAGEEKRETRRRTATSWRWTAACTKAGGPKIVLLPIIGIVPHAPLVFFSVVCLVSESCDGAVSKGKYLGWAVTGEIVDIDVLQVPTTWRAIYRATASRSEFIRSWSVSSLSARIVGRVRLL